MWNVPKPRNPPKTPDQVLQEMARDVHAAIKLFTAHKVTSSPSLYRFDDPVSEVVSLSFQGQSPVDLQISVGNLGLGPDDVRYTTHGSIEVLSVVNCGGARFFVYQKHIELEAGQPTHVVQTVLPILMRAHIKGLNFWRDLRREV